MATNLPQGGTYQGAVGGKQRYNDPTGAVWEQQEFDVGKPTYRTDWTKIQEAPAKPASSVAIAERPGYAAEAANAANALDTDFTPTEEEAAREEVRKAKQAQVDAINKIYDELLTQEQQTGADRMGRSKAIASRSGILETPMGSAQLTKTEQFNAQQQKLLQAERGAKITAIETDMNNRLEEKLRYERELASANYDKKLGLLADIDAKKSETFESAKKNIAELAGTGTMTYDMFKNSDFYNQIRDELGGWDDFTMSKYWDSKQPEPTIKSEQFIPTADGKTKYVAVKMGADGKLKVEEQVLDVALPSEMGGYETKMADNGQVLFIPKNFDGDTSKIVVYGAPGQFNKPEKPSTEGVVTSGGLEITKSQIGELGTALKQNAGSDGYVNTAEYLQGLKNWISLGGLAKDYYSNFLPKDYLNPSDPTIPQNIKNLLKYDEVQALINALGGQ